MIYLPDVKAKEVGPRDGLRAESGILPTGDEPRPIGRPTDAGPRETEATSSGLPGQVMKAGIRGHLIGAS